ncbi:MAG: TolC family protein [Armatimonadetes bacterium]|nr:TolC family protein [Armatimonadota bacterium]
MRHFSSVVLLLIILTQKLAWPSSIPNEISLSSAIEAAISLDPIVLQARQKLKNARINLEGLKGPSILFTVGSTARASKSPGLDPESKITGTDTSYWGYSSTITAAMPGGRRLSLSTSARANTTNSPLRATAGSSYTYAWADLGLEYSIPIPIFRDENVLTEGDRQLAEISVRQAELSLEDAKRKAAADTVDRFFAALRAQQQVEVADANCAEAKELLRIAQTKFEKEKLAEIDVLEAKVAASLAEVTARSALSAAETALEALKNRIGLPLDAEVRLTHKYSLPEGVELSEDEIVSTALVKRSDIVTTTLNEKRDELLLRQAKARCRPGISLVGSYKLMGQTSSISGAWGDLVNPNWFVGLTTSFPLTHTEERAAIEQARGRLIIHQLQRQLNTQEVRLEVRSLLRKTRQSAETSRTLADILKAAEENLKVRLTQLESGLIRPVDVLRTKQELMDIKSRYLNALIDSELAAAKLKLAMGEWPIPGMEEHCER